MWTITHLKNFFVLTIRKKMISKFSNPSINILYFFDQLNQGIGKKLCAKTEELI